jgi:hypothetical protein
MGWGSIKKSFKKGFKDATKFAFKGVKQITAFQLNLYTLGAANKFTSVSKWGGTKTAGKAGAATGITAAALIGGAYVAGAFAPVPVAGAEAVTGSGAVIATGAETSVESFAAYDASLAAGAAEGVGSVAGTGSAFVPVAAGTGTSILSGLGSTSTLLGAGLVSSLFASLKEVGQAGLTSLIEREGKDIFGGGSDSSTTIPGSGSDSGSFFGSSYLPIVLIALTLIGAFILTRKKRRK